MRAIFRSSLIALVAVLAMGAVAVASASAALPEFQQGGKGLAKAVKFSGSAGGPAIRQDGPSCSGLTMTGEISGANTLADVVITFKGCKQDLPPLGGYKPCENTGFGKEEMVTPQLSGKIGYVNKSTKEVGLLLEPSTGTQIAECNYDGSHKYVFKLRGSVIGQLKPVNIESTEFSLAYKGSETKQEITHFEGEEVIHHLEMFNTPFTEKKYIDGSYEGTTNIVTAESLEVKA